MGRVIGALIGAAELVPGDLVRLQPANTGDKWSRLTSLTSRAPDIMTVLQSRPMSPELSFPDERLLQLQYTVSPHSVFTFTYYTKQLDGTVRCWELVRGAPGSVIEPATETAEVRKLDRRPRSPQPKEADMAESAGDFDLTEQAVYFQNTVAYEQFLNALRMKLSQSSHLWVMAGQETLGMIVSPAAYAEHMLDKLRAKVAQPGVVEKLAAFMKTLD